MRMTIESRNKWVLGIAFIVGFVCILVLKLSWRQGDEPSWGATVLLAVVPVVILILYCISAWWVSRDSVSIREMIGDNCYYLGFVFTLVSLAVTLYLLHEGDASGDRDRIPILDVVSGFGVALSSTITGIVLRVLMLRMEPDVQRVDREIRRDIDSVARDLRVHLGASVGELKRGSVRMTQIVAEQADETRKVLIESGEEHKKAVEESVAALKALSAETIETAQTLSERRASLLRSAERVDASMEAVRKGAEVGRSFVETMADLSEQSRGLESSLSTLTDEFGKTRDGVERTVRPAMERIGADAEGFSTVLAESAVRLKAAADLFDGAARRVVKADMQTGIAKAAERLDVSNATLAEVLRELEKARIGRKRRLFGFLTRRGER